MKKENHSKLKSDFHEPEIIFRSESHKVVSKMTQTSSWVRKISSEITSEFDLTPEQASLLRALNDKNGVPVSTNELRYMMLTPMSDTPKIVDRLVKKGLVKKEVDQTDKRLVAVTITEKGRALHDQIQFRSLQIWENLPGFSFEESVMLNSLLDKLKDSIRKVKI